MNYTLLPQVVATKVCSCKTCSSGGIPQALDKFGKASRYKDGYHCWCKECVNRVNRASKYRLKNGEREYKIPPTKVCTICLVEKDIDEFHIHSERADKHESQCKQCRVDHNKTTNILKQTRDANLKRKYGITGDKYDEMMKQQGGMCAICSEPEIFEHMGNGKIKALSVDHNHFTKTVRELLCWSCNTMIGNSRENPEILRRGADYLEKHLALER